MAIPVCTATISGVHSLAFPYKSAGSSITLTGSATETPILEWEWSIDPDDENNKGGYPANSVIALGAVGDFTDGKSSVQNPTVTLDQPGGYCFSLRARNADNWSDPDSDGEDCQAVPFILTTKGVYIPPENEFGYAQHLNLTLSGINQWHTPVDIDFINEEPGQVLSSDTTYSIGGYTWTKINSGGDNVAMAIVPGTGLVISPKQTWNPGTGSVNTDYYISKRTCPAIVLPLTSIYADVSPSSRWRLWLHISSANFTTNYDSVVVALDNNTTVWNANAIRKLYFGGVQHCTDGVWNTNSGDQIGHGTSLGSNDVMVLESATNGSFWATYLGTWNNGWPVVSSLHPASRGGWTGDTIYNVAMFGPPNTWSVLVGAFRAGSTNTFVANIGHIRVDFIP